MNYKSTIAVALILCGASISGYLLGTKSKMIEIHTLKDELRSLESLNREQSDLLSDRYGMRWETLESMDPIGRKHMIMQIWYANQEAGNHFLGREMEHRWGPRWNRRSPLLILEEQTEVMRDFLNGLRKLEEASPYPPKYPTEDDRDPAGGSRIDWENYIEAGNQANPRAIWYGKNRETGNWMAYEYGKGVYTPDSEFLRKIVDHKKIEDDQEDPFSGGE